MERDSRTTTTVLNLARDLLAFYKKRYQGSEQVSIFLCGGGSQPQMQFRKALGQKISAIESKYRYTVFYAEELFADLIYGSIVTDLLALENMLARAVNTVVILLESAGTFTELGAFAQHSKLQDKLLVVVDPKYRKDRSFVNHGPIRLLKRSKKSKVLWHGLEPGGQSELARGIAIIAREMSKRTEQHLELANPISSQDYYLAMIYVLDPIPADQIHRIAHDLSSPTDRINTKAASETVLNYLMGHRFILGSKQLSITDAGVSKLIWSDRSRRAGSELLKQLTEFRIRALNLTYRKHNRWSVTVRP